jgi:hypothetical protein
VESRIATDGKVKVINDRTPVKYEQEDDGVIEPLPLTAAEAKELSPNSAFFGYLGLLRKDN